MNSIHVIKRCSFWILGGIFYLSDGLIAAQGDEVIDLALKFEADSVAFFQQLKKVTPPEWGGGEIDKLIDEEKEHVRKLKELKSNMEKAS